MSNNEYEQQQFWNNPKHCIIWNGKRCYVDSDKLKQAMEQIIKSINDEYGK